MEEHELCPTCGAWLTDESIEYNRVYWCDDCYCWKTLPLED